MPGNCDTTFCQFYQSPQSIKNVSIVSKTTTASAAPAMMMRATFIEPVPKNSTVTDWDPFYWSRTSQRASAIGERAGLNEFHLKGPAATNGTSLGHEIGLGLQAECRAVTRELRPEGR